MVRVLGLAGLATFLVSFDSQVLVLALPAVARDFQASVPALAGLGSVLLLGSVLALPLAMQADRVGRRRLLALAVAGFSLTNLVSAAAPGLAWLAATRAAGVLFETAATSAATALVVEEVAADVRGLAVAGVTVTAGAGTGLTTIVYPLVAPHWRLLYLAGAAGILLAPVLLRGLPESRAWAAGQAERVPLRLLLLAPWRGRLAVVLAVAALSAVLYAPAGLLFALFGSRSLRMSPAGISAVVIVSGLISAPAFILGGRLSDRRGRRGLGVGLTAATALFAGAAFSGTAAAYWAGNLLWSFFASAGVPVVGTWYAELFPTRARATSEAAGALAASVGGIAGLQLVAALDGRLGLGPALVGVAAGALVGAGLLLLLPETRGRPLPG